MLSKTNYIIWRDCHKNAWLKIYKPDIYFAHELSEFEKQIIETGNEVDLLARELFPAGEYQKQFQKDGFLAITDILTHSTISRQTNLYEVKATNDIDKKTHYHDLAFQYNVLKLSGLDIESANLIHLNHEYIRNGEIDINALFVIEDVTEKIIEMADEVLEEMKLAKEYLMNEKEPNGPCDCIYRGRSGQCTTFDYSNHNIPKYGIHDLTRIGSSKKKLIELVDGHKLNFEDIPEDMELSDAQKNQIWTHLNERTIISRENISKEFENLVFPLYFLDYETFPAAIPRFNNFSPYNQIPFQYSLHILETPESEPRHLDFLYTENTDPSKAFAQSLRENLSDKGSVIVWHKDFECSRNKELGHRLPEYKNFFDEVEKRIFDLEVIFKKQYHVHKDYKGKTSIKKVLPVLVPSLKYDDLEIAEGGTAAEKWNQLVTNNLDEKEKVEIIGNLREYCKLDTNAMYAIWRELYKLVN
ncbi:MAG: DUF2779 domain-containing protein [Candidatus Zambryskibacteria bacterium]|nr:DUF2779 domain-containing protein [Candidatus Zambryskibacteria bacterium]